MIGGGGTNASLECVDAAVESSLAACGNPRFFRSGLPRSYPCRGVFERGFATES
jgi:hypothetical protein